MRLSYRAAVVRRVAVAAFALLPACRDAPMAPAGGDPRVGAALTRDTTALFQTDSLTYTLLAGSHGYSGVIGVRFTNRTGSTVYFARDDPRQAAAAESFVAGGAWVSHLVLAETTWVLSTVFSRSARQIAEAVAQLLEHEALVVQDPDVVALARTHLQRKSALGFSDCLILEIARKAGHLPLGTFDRDLGRLDGVSRLKG